MVIEHEYADLTKWANLSPALEGWLRVILLLVGLGLGISIIAKALRSWASDASSGHFSPVRAISSLFSNVIRGILDSLRGLAVGLVELAMIPVGMRRMFGIAWLSIKEALRRRVLYVLVLFLVPFLFAGWYLDKSPEGQLLYLVGFINTAMTWLLLPMVLFVVGLSIPNDLKNRTIQTVATKPVRLSEIIVGRILGFMIVFTGVIAFMGAVSLAFIASQISDSVLQTQWTARVPVFASSPNPGGDRPLPALVFEKQGAVTDRGTNVGREWGYRSHIEGQTSDKAIWFFQFDPNLFKGLEKVKLGCTFDIFKTTKGNPTREDDPTSGVWCELDIVDQDDPSKKFSSVFRVLDNRLTEVEIDTSKADLLKSGKLIAQAQCLTRNQFLGMAKHDLYLLAAQQPFEWNFIKGLAGMWLKVLFLTTIAVASSTVLNGMVTVLLTVSVYVMGIFHDFLMSVAGGRVLGGGFVESGYRLFTQRNQTTELDPSLIKNIAERVDPFVNDILGLVGSLIPDLSTLDTVAWVASGYAIPAWLMARNVLVVVGYVLPALVIGYFLFRGREMAT